MCVHLSISSVFNFSQQALLSKIDLPIEAWKAHLFLDLNKALLSIGNFCDHGCQAVSDDKTVIVLNKGNGKIMMKGKRYPFSNLYMLNLAQHNNLMTVFQTPDECFAGSVYEFKSKGTLVDYHHVSCWSPTQSRWVKAITKTSSLLGRDYHLNLC